MGIQKKSKLLRKSIYIRVIEIIINYIKRILTCRYVILKEKGPQTKENIVRDNCVFTMKIRKENDMHLLTNKIKEKAYAHYTSTQGGENC